MPVFTKSTVLLLITTVLLLVSGCDTNENDPPERISFEAIVQVFVIGEGPNTFVLDRIDSDASYYPLNLPADFQEEGLRVRVEGLLIKNYRVLQHRPVEIISIERLPEE